MVHNKPSHGVDKNGRIEAWLSRDGGESWVLRGAPLEPHCIHVAAGLDSEGHLISIIKRLNGTGTNVCVRSRDRGVTWEVLSDTVPRGNLISSLGCSQVRLIRRTS